MISALKEWLSNPKRDYQQGVTLFESLASEEIRNKYLIYFRSVNGPAIYDQHFTMLVNKLTDIERKIKLNSVNLRAVSPTSDQVQNRKKTIGWEELPEDLLINYRRIQEITPLMARIHSEMSDTAIDNDTRKSKAEELCALDDEKSALWKTIDDWSGKNGVKIQTQPLSAAISTTAPDNGKILRRIAQLKENISRSETAAQKAKTAGKKNLETKARNRIVMYNKELAALEKMIKADDN